MTGDEHNGKLRPFPSTSARADELLRARSRNRPRPLPLPPVPPTNDVAVSPAGHVGYPVPPRRKARPVAPHPSARDLARRDWFLSGLILGAFAGVAVTMLLVFFVLLWG